MDFGSADLSLDLATHPHPRLKTVEEYVAFVHKGLEGVDVRIMWQGSAHSTVIPAKAGIHTLNPGSPPTACGDDGLGRRMGQFRHGSCASVAESILSVRL